MKDAPIARMAIDDVLERELDPPPPPSTDEVLIKANEPRDLIVADWRYVSRDTLNRPAGSSPDSRRLTRKQRRKARMRLRKKRGWR